VCAACSCWSSCMHCASHPVSRLCTAGSSRISSSCSLPACLAPTAVFIRLQSLSAVRHSSNSETRQIAAAFQPVTYPTHPTLKTDSSNIILYLHSLKAPPQVTPIEDLYVCCGGVVQQHSTGVVTPPHSSIAEHVVTQS